MGNKPIRKAKFEPDNGDSTAATSTDISGHFPNENPGDDDAPETVAKEHEETYWTGPEGLSEPTTGDVTSDGLKKAVKAAEAKELDPKGIFETRGDILNDIRDELAARRDAAGLSKSAASDDPSDADSDAAALGRDVLEETEDLYEDMEDLLAQEQVPGDEWSEIEARIAALEAQMADAPTPTTDEAEDIWREVQDRASDILQLLTPDTEPDEAEAEAGDAE